MSLDPLVIATDGVLGTPMQIALLGYFSVDSDNVVPTIVDQVRRINLRYGGSGGREREEKEPRRRYEIHFELRADAPFIDWPNHIEGVRTYTVAPLSDRIVVTVELEDVIAPLDESNEIVIEESSIRLKR